MACVNKSPMGQGSGTAEVSLQCWRPEPSGWPCKQSSELPSVKLTHTSAPPQRAETHAYTHTYNLSLWPLTWTPTSVEKSPVPHLVSPVGSPCDADGVLLARFYGAFTRLQTKAKLLQWSYIIPQELPTLLKKEWKRGVCFGVFIINDQSFCTYICLLFFWPKKPHTITCYTYSNVVFIRNNMGTIVRLNLGCLWIDFLTVPGWNRSKKQSSGLVNALETP